MKITVAGWQRSMLAACVALHASACSAVSAYDAMSAPEPALPNERAVEVPVADARLQVTIATPDGPGPFPLAIINHGANGPHPAAEMRRFHLSYVANYFMSRGYAVAMPMMRGFAGSTGNFEKRGCDLVALGDEAANDIASVIGYMKRQSYVDGARVVVAGESAGGWFSLSLGAHNPADVKGIVSFHGGVRAQDCTAGDAALIRESAALGARTTIPSLWLFGDNDSLFPETTWRAMFDRYRAAGAPAEIVAYGSFGADSHALLGSWEGLRIWTPRLDAFLAKIGLPSTPVHPDDMPMTPPAPSHYAAIDDMNAVPYLHGESMLKSYREFLARPFPRAIAIGEKGSATVYGGFDPLTQALRRCSSVMSGCRLYAFDDTVVWTRAGPPSTGFAALADIDAVPYMNAVSRKGYATFLTAPRPRAFAISPAGGWALSALGPDPLASALKQCNRESRGCALYAVDGDVVWSATNPKPARAQVPSKP